MMRDLVVDMLLYCPKCGTQHVDKADELNGWDNPPHRSHLCQAFGCGHVWRPSDIHTNGVATIRSKGVNDSPVVLPLRSMGRGE